MPSTATPRELRPIAMRSIDLAAQRGARNVEAEHLLMAVVADGTLPAARALADAGYPADWWDHAITDEWTATLSTAGIQAIDHAKLASTPSGARPGWGASARQALKRASLHAVDRGHRHRMDDADVVLGILDAQVGTVPRILARGGIDAGGLANRIRGV